MNNTEKLLIFALGVGIGVLGSMTYFKSKYEKIAQEEIDSINEYNEERRKKEEKKHEQQYKEHYKNMVVNNYSPTYNDEATITTDDDEEDEDYHEYETISKEAAVTRYNAPKPYVISIEDFSEQMDHFDKLTIYYYKEDDTLTDIDEELIDDPVSVIGEEALQALVVENVVYVRNERISTDYEIIRDLGSYSEAMMGCSTDQQYKE